jgi:hypothetical protein
VAGLGNKSGLVPSPSHVSDFLATREGLALIKAFVRMRDAKLRRRIIDLVEEIASDGPEAVTTRRA